MERIAIFIILGGVLGEGMRLLSRRLMQNRTGEPAGNPLLAAKWSRFAWIAAGAAICGLVSLFVPVLSVSIEIMGILLVLASIAVIDNSIRKIPNELIAILLVIKIGAALLNGDPASLIPAAIGMGVGLGLFIIPSYLGLAIGWGDVKLAAVAGFCLGLIGIFQATLIMAAVLGLYLAYLKLSKKGNGKTKVAIGPSLSLGVGLALLFPLTLSIF